jgi:HEAT repeat protein
MDQTLSNADLREWLRALNLLSIGMSAAIDDGGNLLPVSGLGEKLQAAAARLQAFGLLHTVIVAAAQGGIDSPLEQAAAYPGVQRAATVEHAIRVLAHEALPYQGAVRKVPQDMVLPNQARPRFGESIYQVLSLLRPLEEEQPARMAQPSAEEDPRQVWRGVEIRRWEEELLSQPTHYQPLSVEDVLEGASPVAGKDRGIVPRLVVAGPPGSGKSTLLAFLAWRCVYDQPPLAPGGRRCLPVLVRLRNWEQWAVKEQNYALPDYLAHTYEGLIHPPDASLCRQWLRLGLVFLLLDGLDEIHGDPTYLEQGLKALLDAEAYARCPLVLTCRTVFYDQYRALGHDLPLFALGGLDDRQQVAFVRAYPARSSHFDPDSCLEGLRRLPYLRPLAANPLLLSIFCLVADDPHGLKLPLSRGDLYQRTLARLLEAAKKQKRVEVAYPRQASNLTRARKQQLAEETALQLWLAQTGRRLSFGEEQLQEALTQAVSHLPGYEAVTAPLVDALLVDLRDNAGLWRGSEGGEYVFLHLTIQEFLVACALARRLNERGWEQAQVSSDGHGSLVSELILKRAWDPGWQEVLVFLAGRLKKPDTMLRALLTERVTAFHQLLLLAGRCLGEIGEQRVDAGLSEEIVKGLLALLSSVSEVDRQRASKVLGEMASKRALEGLLAALRNNDSGVAAAAARALGQIADQRATEGLLAALSGSDSNVSWAAARALGQIGDPAALPALLQILYNAPSDEVPAAVRALREIGARAVPYLLQALDDLNMSQGLANPTFFNAHATGGEVSVIDSQLSDVRPIIVRALGIAGDRSAVPALLQVRDDPDRRIATAARWALSQIEHRPEAAELPAAMNDLVQVLKEAVTAKSDERDVANGLPLQQVQPSEEPKAPLLHALDNPRSDVSSTLAQVTDPFDGFADVPAFAEGLSSTAEGVEPAGPAAEIENLALAADTLRLLADPDAELQRLMQDPDSDLYWALTQVLEHFDTLADIPKYVESMQQNGLKPGSETTTSRDASNSVPIASLLQALRGPNWPRRMAASDQLAAIGAPAVQGLLQVLRESRPEDEAAWGAAEALRKMTDRMAVPHLLQAMKDPIYFVRGIAMQALGSIGDPVAVPALSEALQDPHNDVRQVAAEALGKIGNHAEDAALVRGPAIPEATLEELVEALRTQDNALRRSAYKSLLQLEIGASASMALSTLIDVWQNPALDDDKRRECYEMMAGLASRAYAADPAHWVDLSHNLIAPTAYTLATSLETELPERARDAETGYRHVLQHLPGFGPALQNLGLLLLEWPGRAGEAAAILEQHISQHSGDAISWYGLGLAHGTLKDYQQSLRAFRQSASVAKESRQKVRALLQCAGACISAAQQPNAGGHWVKDARDYLGQVATLEPDHPYSHVRAAQLHLVRGDWRTAKEEAREADYMGVRSAELRFVQGLALLRSGLSAAAAEEYERGARRAEDWRDVQEAIEALERETSTRTLPGGDEILSRLRSRHAELVARWSLQSGAA